MRLFLEAPVAFINEDRKADLTLMNYPLICIGMSFETRYDGNNRQNISKLVAPDKVQYLLDAVSS